MAQWPTRGQRAPEYWDVLLKEYIDEIAARSYGVVEHGEVSGDVTFSGPRVSHRFDATGPTTITLDNFVEGQVVSLICFSGAEDVQINGFDDAVLVDGQAWAAEYARGVWVSGGGSGSGGGPVDPVVDPPTQPGAVTVTPTNDGFTLSWVASTVASGYEVQIDGGTWVDSGVDTSHTYTGLSAGSEHSGAVRAYNSLGAKSTPRAWGPASVNMVGLHEQLLALEPTYYLRTSRGSLESFGAESGWAFVGTPNFTGPSLMAGETGSVLTSGAGAYLLNGNATALNGIESITVVALLQPATSLTNVFNVQGLAAFGGSSAPSAEYVNEYSRNGQTHLYAVTRGTGATQSQWRDGVAVNVDGQPFNVGASPTEGDAYIGSWWAGGGGGFYLSHIAIFVNQILPSDTMAALAQAAGTTGNPT